MFNRARLQGEEEAEADIEVAAVDRIREINLADLAAVVQPV